MFKIESCVARLSLPDFPSKTRILYQLLHKEHVLLDVLNNAHGKGSPTPKIILFCCLLFCYANLSIRVSIILKLCQHNWGPAYIQMGLNQLRIYQLYQYKCRHSHLLLLVFCMTYCFSQNGSAYQSNLKRVKVHFIGRK